MRKVALLVALVAAALAVAGLAQAANQTHTLVVKLKNAKKPSSPTKPSNVTLFTDLITKPGEGDQPFATKNTVVYFDKNLTFGGKYLKTCSRAQVQQDDTKCPSNSKVGSGKATGTALGQTENLTVTAFNGPGGNKLELHVVGSAPLQIDSVIEGTLKDASGKFGKKLTVEIPENLQQPLTGVYATLTDFQVTVKGTGTKKRPYIGLKNCPSGKRLFFKSTLTFTDGTVKNATATAPCTR